MRLKTILALCLLSMAVFAQKAPKGKLLYYSHISVNPEIPVDDDFDLCWTDGKGILTIKQTDAGIYTDEVGEDVFRQVADIIKAKKLYAKGKKKKMHVLVPIDDPGVENYTLRYEDKYISYDVGDLNKEQWKAFADLEKFIMDAVNFVQPPKGKLVECSLSSESSLPGRGGEFKCLSVRENEGPVLIFGRSTSPIMSEEDSKYIISTEDVQNLQELILKEKLYKVARYNGDLSGGAPVRRVFLKYDDGNVYSARFQYPSIDVARAESAISDFFNSLSKKYQPVSKDRLLYYSHTILNPEIPLEDDFSLSRTADKGTLNIRQLSNSSTSEYIGEVSEDVLSKIADIIKTKQLCTVIKKEEEDNEPMPYAYPGRDRLSIHFENESVNIDYMDLTPEQKKAFEELETYIKKQSKEIQFIQRQDDK